MLFLLKLQARGEGRADDGAKIPAVDIFTPGNADRRRLGRLESKEEQARFFRSRFSLRQMAFVQSE